MRWFPLALLLYASFACAQSDANQKAIRVEGTILSLNGDLVRKATVRLQGTGGQPSQLPVSYLETTDSAGKFLFDDVAPGRYTLSAEKPGFVGARYGARSNTSAGTQLNLTAGMEMKDLAIKMTPQGVIAGKVLDRDGDPVISVQVQAMRFAYTGGRKQLQPTGGAQTNDLGEYRLINLAPGRYYVTATDPRVTQFGIQERPGRVGEAQIGNITTYYPNGADPSSAVAVDVAAGSEMRGIDIRLLKAKVYTVRGKAAGDLGELPSATVTLSRKDDSSSLPALLNGGGTSALRPDGTFEFRNILPGTYLLQLAPINVVNGNSRPNLTGRTEVTVGDADVEGLVLPVGPAPEISGKLSLEDGDIATVLKQRSNPASAGNAVVQAYGLQLILAAVGGAPGAWAARVEPDGSFRFANLPRATYALDLLTVPPGTYLKSASMNGQDVKASLIDTTSGAGGTLELVFSSKSAEINVSVKNDKGEPLTGTFLTLWPKIPEQGFTGSVRPGISGQDGGFRFQNLAPGDYYVAAWEDVDQGPLLSADFLSHFTSDASAITLAESGQESQDLKPVPADKVALEIAKLP